MTQSRLLRCHDCTLIAFHYPTDDGRWKCESCGIVSETVQGSLVMFATDGGEP